MVCIGINGTPFSHENLWIHCTIQWVTKPTMFCQKLNYQYMSLSFNPKLGDIDIALHEGIALPVLQT